MSRRHQYVYWPDLSQKFHLSVQRVFLSPFDYYYFLFFVKTWRVVDSSSSQWRDICRAAAPLFCLGRPRNSTHHKVCDGNHAQGPRLLPKENMPAVRPGVPVPHRVRLGFQSLRAARQVSHGAGRGGQMRCGGREGGREGGDRDQVVQRPSMARQHPYSRALVVSVLK